MSAGKPKFITMRKMRKLLAGVMIGGTLALAACGERNAYKPPPPPKVTVSRPMRQMLSDNLEFTGNTQAINTVTLRARVQGYLEKVLFRDGDRVKKGQVLLIIQQNTYKDKLEQAEAQVLREKANNRYASIQVTRYTDLVQKKAGAQSDLDNWRYQRDASRAAILAAEASRDLAKLDLSYTTVTAPFDGRIDRRLVDPGNLVGANDATPLVLINQIDPIYVYFTINEADLLQVLAKSGKSMGEVEKSRIPLYLGLADETGYPHRGYLDFAGISLTPTTGTLQMRGVFPNPDFKIMPGLFARIRGPVIGTEREALLIPEVAIAYDQLGPYVLVVGANNVVEHRSVKLGARVGEQRRIETGLTADDSVIILGMLKAVPGKPVTPMEESQKPAPAGSGPPSQEGSGKSAP